MSQRSSHHATAFDTFVTSFTPLSHPPVPEPRKDHAPAMCRFAQDLLLAIQDLTPRLEVFLGPDTCDLAIRIGIHSGPVTVRPGPKNVAWEISIQ